MNDIEAPFIAAVRAYCEWVDAEPRPRRRRCSPEARAHLNEDDGLIAFTVAMNGNDLDAAIEELQGQGAAHGTDFVATASGKGVLGDVPGWLSETSARIGPFKQLTKFYSLVSEQP